MEVQPLDSRPLRRQPRLSVVDGPTITPIYRHAPQRDTLDGVLRLMSAAGFATRVAWPLGETLQAPAGTQAALALRQGPGAGHLTMPPGLSVQPIRGLRGLLSGPQPSLDVIVIGIDLPAWAGREDQAVAQALALARRLGRTRLCLALDPRVDFARGVDLPGCRQDVATTAADLVAQPGKLDVIVTTEEHATILAATAIALSGSRHCVARARSRDGHVFIDDAAHDDANEPNAAAIVAAGVLTLRLLGAGRVAERIEDAFLSALESGLRTPDVALALPYCRQVDNEVFLREVEQRLGQQPRRKANRTALTAPPRQTPALHCIA